MSKLVFAMTLVAAAGSVAFADRVPVPVDSLAIPAELQNLNGTRGTFPTFFENFESFTPGPLVPQGGWNGLDSNAFATNVNPISGISARHTSDGSGTFGFEMNSPVFAPSFGVLASDIRLSGTNSLYQYVPVANTTGFFPTRINFETNGDIRVGQVNAAMDAFDFIDSGFDWTPGVTFRLGVGVASDGALTVALDGATIFTGLDASFVLTGSAGQIDQLATWTDNVGFGDSGGSGDTMTLDNVGVPAPGAAAVFALGGLVSLRRRRR